MSDEFVRTPHVSLRYCLPQGLRIIHSRIILNTPFKSAVCLSGHRYHTCPRFRASVQALYPDLNCNLYQNCVDGPFAEGTGGCYRGVSLIRNVLLLGPYSRTMPRALWGSHAYGPVGVLWGWVFSYERGTPVSGLTPPSRLDFFLQVGLGSRCSLKAFTSWLAPG